MKNEKDGTSSETKLKSSKGELGEDYVDEAVKIFGWNVIKFDFFQASADRIYYKDGVSILSQMKYKEPRIMYPDTGLEMYKYNKLKSMSKETGIQGMILFTDASGRIYGDYLDCLKEEDHGGEFNKHDGVTMIYFWLKDLKELRELL